MSESHDLIPRTLDDPPLIFLWEVDTACIFIIWCILGAVLGNVGLLFGVTIGFICAKAYTRLKDEGGRRLICKIMYWFLPSSHFISKRHPSHIREHFGR